MGNSWAKTFIRRFLYTKYTPTRERKKRTPWVCVYEITNHSSRKQRKILPQVYKCQSQLIPLMPLKASESKLKNSDIYIDLNLILRWKNKNEMQNVILALNCFLWNSIPIPEEWAKLFILGEIRVKFWRS